jgi:hypothetical protein
MEVGRSTTTDRQTDGRTDGRTDGQTDGRTDGLTVFSRLIIWTTQLWLTPSFDQKSTS